MSNLFSELKRRHVFKVAAAYVVTSWLVLQLADIVLPAFGAPAWVMRVVIGLSVLCFPVALVLAWAFEITPEGVRRAEDGDTPADRPRPAGRRAGALNVSIVVTLVAALALLAWRQLGPAAASSRSAEADTGNGASVIPDRSVAVLPFVNMSADSASEYFSDGITEEILNALAQVPGLQVAGRTSSFAYKGKNEDLTEIGRELRVAFVLEGSVQRAGEEVRITAQLIDARTGYHRWSQKYDRDLKNVFAVEDEISRAIADALKLKLGAAAAAPREARGTADVRAHDLYLLGLHAWNRRTPEDLRKAIQYFQEAIAQDSSYADAWAGLAEVLATPSTPLPPSVALPRAKDAARNALSIDSLLPQAHTALAFALMLYDYDWQGARDEFARALSADPGYPMAHSWLSVWYDTQGRTAEAVESSRQAERLDPLSMIIGWTLGQALVFDRRYGEARKQLEEVLALHPGEGRVLQSLVDVSLVQGDTVAGRPYLEQFLATGDLPANLQSAIRDSLRTRGFASAARALRPHLSGRNDLFPQLEQGLEHRALGFLLTMIVADPGMDSIRDDPRYMPLLESVGLGDAGRRIDQLRRSARVGG